IIQEQMNAEHVDKTYDYIAFDQGEPFWKQMLPASSVFRNKAKYNLKDAYEMEFETLKSIYLSLSLPASPLAQKLNSALSSQHLLSGGRDFGCLQNLPDNACIESALNWIADLDLKVYMGKNVAP